MGEPLANYNRVLAAVRRITDPALDGLGILQRWPVDEVLKAAGYYLERTGRRVSIEYALIRDVNDQPWRADLLAKRLRQHLGHLVHVNVIPLNPTPGSKWDASPKPVEREFVRRVNAGGVACTVRDTRGQEIAAACGQLAAEDRR
jgi:23S rRNA (adenine2503-C2)-methyltransferase